MEGRIHGVEGGVSILGGWEAACALHWAVGGVVTLRAASVEVVLMVAVVAYESSV